MKLRPLSSSSLLSFLLFATLLFPSGCKDEAPQKVDAPIEVAVLPVMKKDVPRIVEFVGETKGSVDAEIRARVEGVITGIHFDEGKPVTSGMLLYTIDPAPFVAKRNEANAFLAEAKTKLAKAEADLKRIEPLAKINAVSKRDLDSAVAQHGTAVSAVDAATASLESADIQLSYTKITSPTDGVIGLSKAKVGEFVGRAPNPIVLAMVSKLDPIHVKFAVNEKDYLFFARLKQKKDAAADAAPPTPIELILADNSVHPEKGYLVAVEGQMSASTGSILAEAAFPNPEKILRSGQFAKLKVVAETLTDAMLLPRTAIKDTQGIKQVLVIGADGVVELRAVTVGAELGEQQVILSGLNGDEQVAIERVQQLRPGMKVTPRLTTVQ